VAKSRPEKSAWRERSEEKLRVAQALLAEEVAALRSGDDWQRFLEVQANLHAYSPRNILLVVAQHALAYAEGRTTEASPPALLAGYQRWRSLGRAVERGQRGYAILAPLRYGQRLATAPDGTTRSLGRGAAPEPGEVEERRQVLAGFKVEHVFALEQTTGEPIPLPPRPELLVGEAPAGLGASVLELVERRGFAVSTVPSADAIGGANGLTDLAARTVVVRADMDDAAMVRTLLHEAAHVLLHTEGAGQALARAVKEVEAESVAFVVSRAHGMASDAYSFPYVATWAGEAGAALVQATQDRVAAAARVLLASSPALHTDGGKLSTVPLLAPSADPVLGADPAPEPERLGIAG
jgi:hypothetical protein